MVITEDSRMAAHSLQPCNLSQAELEHLHGQAGRCCRHRTALGAVDGLKDLMEGVRHCQKLSLILESASPLGHPLLAPGSGSVISGGLSPHPSVQGSSLLPSASAAGAGPGSGCSIPVSPNCTEQQLFWRDTMGCVIKKQCCNS